MSREAALLAQRGLHGDANRAAIGASADPSVAGDAQGQTGAGLIDVAQALASTGAAHARQNDGQHNRGDRHNGGGNRDGGHDH